MSTVERNKGVLREVTIHQIREEFPSADLSDLEWGTNGKYVRIKDKYFRVFWEVQSESDCSYFCNVVKDDIDDSIHFHTLHYNGAAHWTELLEEKINE